MIFSAHVAAIVSDLFSAYIPVGSAFCLSKLFSDSGDAVFGRARARARVTPERLLGGGCVCISVWGMPLIG